MIDYDSFFESFGSHELSLFNCFLWVFAFVFAFIFRLFQLFSLSFVCLFVYGILFFQLSFFTFSQPSSLFISPHEDQTIPRMRQFLLRPTQAIVRCYARTSIEIDVSVFLESLFGDIGAFAWSMVIDWSIFWNMVR